MLQVQELIYDTDADEYVATETFPLPASVTVLNFADFFRVTYGEPLDVARTVTASGDDISVGWTYPLAGDAAAEFGIENGERVAIPLWRDDAGGVTPLFELLRRQTDMSQLLEADPRVNVVRVAADEPWSPGPEDDPGAEVDAAPLSEGPALASVDAPLSPAGPDDGATA